MKTIQISLDDDGNIDFKYEGEWPILVALGASDMLHQSILNKAFKIATKEE